MERLIKQERKLSVTPDSPEGREGLPSKDELSKPMKMYDMNQVNLVKIRELKMVKNFT